MAVRLLNRRDLVAPDLMIIEVANALRRKVIQAELTWAQASEGFRLVEAFVDLRRIDLNWLDRSLEMALQMAHPIYDCIYLALAELADAPLVTADRELLSRARRANFGHLVSELTQQ